MRLTTMLLSDPNMVGAICEGMYPAPCEWNLKFEFGLDAFQTGLSDMTGDDVDSKSEKAEMTEN